MCTIQVLNNPYQWDEALYKVDDNAVEAFRGKDATTWRKKLNKSVFSNLTKAQAASDIGLSSSTTPTTLAIMPVEIHDTKRVYVVGTWSTFLRAIEARRARGIPCPCYELYQEKTPVHVFLDVDKALETDEDGAIDEATWSAHLRALVLHVFRALSGVTHAKVVVSEAHKATKRSYHVLMKLEGGSVMVRSATDLYAIIGAAMKDVDTARPFALMPDMAPYRKNHQMRMLHCCKANEPNRIFRLAMCYELTRPSGGGGEVVETPVPIESVTMEDTLITYVAQGTAVTGLLSSTAGGGGSSGKRSHDMVSASDMSDFYRSQDDHSSSNSNDIYAHLDRVKNLVQDHLTAALNISNKVSIFGLKRFLTEKKQPQTLLILATSGHYCEIKAQHHRSNHVYYVVSLEQRSFWQRCFDETCTSMSKRRRLDEHSSSSSSGEKKENAQTTMIMRDQKGRGKTHFLKYTALEPISKILELLATTTATDMASSSSSSSSSGIQQLQASSNDVHHASLLAMMAASNQDDLFS